MMYELKVYQDMDLDKLKSPPINLLVVSMSGSRSKIFWEIVGIWTIYI